MFHAVEDAVSDLGLAELQGAECDVIVGGLGLGYTAVTALAHANVRSLRVIEMLPAVIGWHRRGLVPLGEKLTSDPRCELVEGDFFKLATDPAGFEAGRRYHAVLLDIDHTPRDYLAEQNAGFYTSAGLQAFSAHLLPGGVFTMWSDDLPDADFLQVLSSAFVSVRAEVVTFPNPLLDRDSAGTVYLARRPLA
jgi:spermidine synthase